MSGLIDKLGEQATMDSTALPATADIELTKLQVEALADHVARGMDIEPASKAIGYLDDLEKLKQLTHSFGFVELVRARREVHVQASLVPKAFKELENLMTNQATPAGTRLQAVKLTLEIARLLPGQMQTGSGTAATVPADHKASALVDRVANAARVVQELEAKTINQGTPAKAQKSTDCTNAPHKKHG